jgi:hypothetical protein
MVKAHSISTTPVISLHPPTMSEKQFPMVAYLEMKWDGCSSTSLFTKFFQCVASRSAHFVIINQCRRHILFSISILSFLVLESGLRIYRS